MLRELGVNKTCPIETFENVIRFSLPHIEIVPRTGSKINPHQEGLSIVAKRRLEGDILGKNYSLLEKKHVIRGNNLRFSQAL